MRAVLLGIAVVVGVTGPVLGRQLTTPTQQAQVRAWANSTLADPYSLQDTAISDQFVTADGIEAICFQFNAKNAMGGYTGVYRAPFRIVGNGLNLGRDMGLDTGTCWNRGIAWYPFKVR